MTKRREPSAKAAGIPKRHAPRKRGTTFDVATGAATAGSRQGGVAKTITNVFDHILSASTRFGNLASGKGPNLTPPSPEFRHRKRKYGGSLKHGKKGI